MPTEVSAFARDGAVPGSKIWMGVKHKLSVPVNAMILCMVVEVILGLIYVGSSAAFNAFSGVIVISLAASYAYPVATNLTSSLAAAEDDNFSLGRYGCAANVIDIFLLVFALLLFCMPAIPVQATTVNYASRPA
ncbi:hypothetical protein K4F52_009969 [Lecanicillium sp. MT-2017a]|nr:hypothetical protein K4F52_009969 [Lecanicillium sp. MT-2017a]